MAVHAGHAAVNTEDGPRTDVGQSATRNPQQREKKLSAPGLEPGTYGLKVRCSTN
jgi:hypothetical protein